MADPLTDLYELEVQLDALHRMSRPFGFGWIVCPRAHAVAHLFEILDCMRRPERRTPSPSDIATFRARDRFHAGEDLVFALGPLQ